MGNRGHRDDVEGSVVVRRAIMAVALAAIVATMLLVLHSSRAQVSAAADQLRTVRSQLSSAQSSLERAAAARDVANAQAQAAAVQRTKRQIERDTSYANYQALERQLHKQQSTLTDTAQDLTQRFTRLGYLNQCLDGASKALNQAAVADYVGVAATLKSVQLQCIAAKGTS